MKSFVVYALLVSCSDGVTLKSKTHSTDFEDLGLEESLSEELNTLASVTSFDWQAPKE